MLRGLFEGVQYNSEAGAKCAVYSRARTKQGRGVIKEIRYMYIYTRNVLLSAQMGEQASVVLICIITSRYNEVK